MQAADGYFSYGMNVDNSLHITNNADVTVLSGIPSESYKAVLGMETGQLVIDSGKLTCSAAECNGDFSCAVSTGELTMNGGEVILSGNNYDLEVWNGKPVIPSNASVSFQGTGLILIKEGKYIWDEASRTFVCAGHEEAF